MATAQERSDLPPKWIGTPGWWLGPGRASPLRAGRVGVVDLGEVGRARKLGLRRWMRGCAARGSWKTTAWVVGNGLMEVARHVEPARSRERARTSKPEPSRRPFRLPLVPDKLRKPGPLCPSCPVSPAYGVGKFGRWKIWGQEFKPGLPQLEPAVTRMSPSLDNQLPPHLPWNAQPRTCCYESGRTPVHPPPVVHQPRFPETSVHPFISRSSASTLWRAEPGIARTHWPQAVQASALTRKPACCGGPMP